MKPSSATRHPPVVRYDAVLEVRGDTVGGTRPADTGWSARTKLGRILRHPGDHPPQQAQVHVQMHLRQVGVHSRVTGDLDSEVGPMLGTGHRRPAPSVEQRDVITVVGDLDRAGLDRLRALCRPVPMASARSVSIDFRGMTGCPSALFPLLADANATLRAADMELNLIGLTEALVEIMAPRGSSE